MPQAFIDMDAAEYRQRIIPTLASLQLYATVGKVHPAIGRLVYVIPEGRFGKVMGVHESGYSFYVENNNNGRTTEREYCGEEGMDHRSEDEYTEWEGRELLAT